MLYPDNSITFEPADNVIGNICQYLKGSVSPVIGDPDGLVLAHRLTAGVELILIFT